MFCVLHYMYLLCIDLPPFEWFMMQPPLLLSDNIRFCVISTVVCCHEDSLIMSYIFKQLLNIFIMCNYIGLCWNYDYHIKAIEEISIM